MRVVLERTTKFQGVFHEPGSVITVPDEKACRVMELGIGHLIPETFRWSSPLFGHMEGGPILEINDTHFTLVHPLTDERVSLPMDWMVSMEERSAILEDSGLSRDASDRQAKQEFFDLFG